MIATRSLAPVLGVDAISTTLQCPRPDCRKSVVQRASSERYRGAIRCEDSRCRTRWFAEPLEAGSVVDQLMVAYEDARIVDDLMRRFRLPASIPSPAFLQIPISLDLWTQYVGDRDVPRQRDRSLLRRVLSA